MTKFAASSHQGRVRAHNEDCFASDATLGLWLVADGVGGHSHGEVAAAIARDAICDDIAAGGNLLGAIDHAHRSVLSEIARRESGSNMGSTVVALHLREGCEYDIGWVGDSRAYLFDGSLRQLTRDHNPVSDLLDRGLITSEQAATHPERNVLNQSLGVSQAIVINPGHVSGTLLPGQQILLCSDGLTDELSDETLVEILSIGKTVEAQAEALVEAALASGGRDNITVVIVGESPVPASEGVGSKPDLEAAQTMEFANPEPPSKGIGRYMIVGVVLLGVLILALSLW